MINGEERVKRAIQERITIMFDEILNYAEVAVPNKYTYDKLRNRVLTAGNNAIRDLQLECNLYEITYLQRIDEVVKVETEEK